MKHTFPLFWLSLLLLSACAAHPPEALREAPAQSPSLSQVRAQADAYTDSMVSWGGTIAEIENLQQSTRLEVVARRLSQNGKPVIEDSSEGRFLAHFDSFLDPSIYAVGRSITVVGRLSGIEEREIDKMRYHYPVVAVSSHHLWPEPEPYEYPPYPYDPFFYDPFFYDPWYPFRYPYPYYPYHHPKHHH